MRSYVGWSPTILGRVSFSRIGEEPTSGSVCCNATDSEGFLFGVSRRKSHDGPLPAWLTNLFGRFPYTDWAFFLECQPGELPYQKSSCANADDEKTDVVLRKDERAEIAGTLYFCNGASKRLGKAAADAFADCRDNAWTASNALATGHVRSELYHRTHSAMMRASEKIRADSSGGRPTPIFGKVSVVFSRTGMCRISVDERDLITTASLKELARSADAISEDESDLHSDHMEDIAAQAFFVIRDLTHQHYHHKKHSDLLTTVTPWTPAEDENWRRETQYGLARMAIAVRRVGKAETFRQALGIMAYAQAFQSHLCGWFSPAPGKVEKSEASFAYDFAALKASTEASLKVRELKDSNLRARMFFAFGTAITALSVLVPVYRTNTTALPWWSDGFRDVLVAAVGNPIVTLVGAGLTGWAIDHAILSWSVYPEWFEKSRASVSRLIGGFMGMLRRHRVTAAIAQAAALTLMGLFLLSMLLVTYLGYRYVFGAIGMFGSA